MATRAPSAARRSAMARPMRLAAPVTRTTLPVIGGSAVLCGAGWQPEADPNGVPRQPAFRALHTSVRQSSPGALHPGAAGRQPVPYGGKPQPAQVRSPGLQGELRSPGRLTIGRRLTTCPTTASTCASFSGYRGHGAQYRLALEIRVVNHVVVGVLDQVVKGDDAAVDALFVEQIQIDVGDYQLLLVDGALGGDPVAGEE